MKLIGPPLDDPSWQFYFFCPPSFPPFLKETDTFISSFFRRGNVPKCVRSPPAAGIIRVVSPQKSFSLPNLIIIREQYVNCRWCSSSALQWVDFVFFQSVESVPVFFFIFGRWTGVRSRAIHNNIFLRRRQCQRQQPPPHRTPSAGCLDRHHDIIRKLAGLQIAISRI